MLFLDNYIPDPDCFSQHGSSKNLTSLLITIGIGVPSKVQQ